MSPTPRSLQNPPYATVESFYACLRHLKQVGIPNRIGAAAVGLGDRAGTWSHVQATFRVLDLIDAQSAPTTALRALVAGIDGQEWPGLLHTHVLPRFEPWLHGVAPRTGFAP